MYQNIFRPLLFRFDPEQVHSLTIQLMRIAGFLPPVRSILCRIYNAHSHNSLSSNQEFTKPTQIINAFGLRFTNRVGLAAGYDKDGLALKGLATLGFGHIEVGTVTPLSQNGNPKPRVFRIPEDHAIINRMGFPGKGADFVARQVSKVRGQMPATIIGVNIGKNKETPNEEAAQDYLYLLEKFTPLADYLTVNVSSPNTAGLRRLQARESLESILTQLNDKRSTLPASLPILVKLAPDLSGDELDDALAAITNSGMDGVIATNTTIDRAGLRSTLKQESGGLSGAPLTARSRGVIQNIHAKTRGQLPIIGVGGIMNPDDAKMMLDAGASLIQLYTGMIYEGPSLVKNILEEL